MPKDPATVARKIVKAHIKNGKADVETGKLFDLEEDIFNVLPLGEEYKKAMGYTDDDDIECEQEFYDFLDHAQTEILKDFAKKVTDNYKK